MNIRVNGVNLFYEKRGQGKAMILLHGNGEDHTTFNKAATILEKKYTLYLVDTRGHGKSTGSDFHYDIFADDVKAFIEALDIEKPIILGFSDGAITALLLASRYPELPSALVSAGGNTTPDGLKDEVKAYFEKEYEASPSPLISLMLREPHITEEELAKIKVPTLVLAGENDMIKLEDTMKIASSIPNAKLRIIKGEDHISYVFDSDIIAKVIEEEASFICP